MSGAASVPPLPPGYTLDDSAPSTDQPVASAAPPPLPPGYTLDQASPTVPLTTWRGVAKNAAAATAVDAPAGLINFATDPGGALLHGLTVAGGTAYDAAAHATGWFPPMSPELRSALYDQPPPGQARPPAAPPPSLSPEARAYIDQQPPGQPPPDQGAGTRLMNRADAPYLPADRSATTLATRDSPGRRRAFRGAAPRPAPRSHWVLHQCRRSSPALPPPPRRRPRSQRPTASQSSGVESAVNTIPQMSRGALPAEPDQR